LLSLLLRPHAPYYKRQNYKKQGRAEDLFQLQCQTPKSLQDEVAGAI
jgi:hypothetical protein